MFSSFANTANITGTWNATTGTLTLAGSDTVADYQAALRAVTYQNTSQNPRRLTRTVSFTVNDGAANSNTVTRTITVTDTTTQWTGAADTHWENAANWTNGVLPGATVEAVLTGTPAANQPVLYQNQAVVGLDIRTAGWTLNVNGWTLSVGTGGLALPGGGTPTARIDLGSGNLVVSYSGSSPLGTIQGWIQAGGGTQSNGLDYDWNGTGGITSSAAAANNENTSLGLRDNGFALQGRPAMTEVGGVPVPATAIVVKYTWMGDMDLDGTVTVNDYLEFLHYYASPPAAPDLTWMTGDFKYNGKIGVDDYLLLLTGYDHQSGPLAGSPAQVVEAPAAAPVTSEAAAPAPAAAMAAPRETELIIGQLRKSGGNALLTAEVAAPETLADDPQAELAVGSARHEADAGAPILTVTPMPGNATVLKV